MKAIMKSLTVCLILLTLAGFVVFRDSAMTLKVSNPYLLILCLTVNATVFILLLRCGRQRLSYGLNVYLELLVFVSIGYLVFLAITRIANSVWFYRIADLPCFSLAYFLTQTLVAAVASYQLCTRPPKTDQIS